MSSLPRILLLQARNEGDPVLVEERQSFAAKAGVAVERIVPWDLLGGPPTFDQVRRYDALMVGGSGDYYVSKGNLPEFDRLLELLIEVVDRGHPLFASCFGFQLMVRALGGEIVSDFENIEVGTFEVRLSPAGRDDELFGRLPPVFEAQLGRKDRAAALPAGVPTLAASERSPHQAFRIPGKPIWATQFHPELDRETNLGRYFRYLDGYAAHMSEAEREAAIGLFRESPDSARLLPGFLELVFG